jgi:hypothetical protein
LAIKRTKTVSRWLDGWLLVLYDRFKPFLVTGQRFNKRFPDVLVTRFVIANVRMK